MTFRACAVAGLLVFACGANVKAQAPAGKAAGHTLAASAPGVRHTQSLADLGYADGLALEGTRGEKDLFFEVPLGEHARDATVRLAIQFAVTLLPSAGVTVLVNGVPQASVARVSADAQGWVDITVPIESKDLQSDYLRITLRYALVTDRDVCFDQRLGLGFMKVGGKSGLDYTVPASVARTALGAWSLLPHRVRIGVPLRALTKAELDGAYMIAAGLQRRGHEVSVEPLSGAVDIAVARPSEMSNARVMNATDEKGTVIQLVEGSTPDHTVILIGSAQHVTAASLLNRTWQSAVTGSVVAIRSQTGHRAEGPVVIFTALDGGDLRRSFSESATWSFPLSLRDMPYRRTPTRVRLNVVSSGAPAGSEVVLQSYLNGTLIGSDQLNLSGHLQTVGIELPAYLLQTTNELKFVARREGGGGHCENNPGAYPVQIMSNSSIDTKQISGKLHGFRDLALVAEDSLSVYIEQPLASNPVRVLRHLLQLSANFWSDDLVPAVHYFETGAKLKPTHAFIVFSRSTPAKIDAPLRVNKGRIQMHAATSDPLLMNLSQAGRWTVMQTATMNGQTGLWVAPAADDVQIPAVTTALGREDIALVDATGHSFRFNSSEREVFDLSGSERAGLKMTLAPFRIPAFILGFLIVTAGVIYLAILTRRHRQ